MQRPTILVRLRSVMRSMILLMVWLLTSFTIWVVVVDFESTLIADNFMFWNTTKTTIRNVTLITARSCENMDYCKIVWQYGLLHDRVKILTTAWSCENMDYCMIVWKYGLLHDRVKIWTTAWSCENMDYCMTVWKYGLLHDRVKIWTNAWSCENMDYCMIVWNMDYCMIVWKYGLLHDRAKIWTTAWSCDNMILWQHYVVERSSDNLTFSQWEQCQNQ